MVLAERVKSEKQIERSPRFRFAPSPTGGLHIGTARTALFNWLAAKSMNGKLILRIEDTDLKRSKESYEESIINDLKWLGISWDEFYRQSDRLKIYQSYANKLLNEDQAYMCFCSHERLENLKNEQLSKGKASQYDNKCKELGSEEIEKNLREGKKFTIRFKVKKGDIEFNDLIRGKIKFSSEVIGDFIIIKSDGTPSYNFAVVVDDSDMMITYVLRGEDHIANTAKQIMLFKRIGCKIPYFAHLSMILGTDGAKLSKRHGADTITQFRESGYLSEAMSNYLSLLSWAPRDDEEIFYLLDIIGKFRLEDISKSPAIFDVDKLNWINGNHIRKKTDLELINLCMPFIIKKDVVEKEILEDARIKIKLLRCIDAFKNNLKVLSDFPEYVKEFFIEKISNYNDDALEVLKMDTSARVLRIFLEEMQFKLKSNKFNKNYDLDESESKEIINTVGMKLEKEKIKGRFLYMPIRSSLTGKIHGPELPKIISILGLENCISRLKYTLNNIIGT